MLVRLSSGGECQRVSLPRVSRSPLGGTTLDQSEGSPMKTTMLIILSIVFVQGCTNGSSIQTKSIEPPKSDAVIVEGTVLYSSGGGTREMLYPPGYVLANIQWVTPTLDSPSPVYVSGVVGSGHVNKHVRVFGTRAIVTRHGTPSSYIYSYSRIAVDSVRIIN